MGVKSATVRQKTLQLQPKYKLLSIFDAAKLARLRFSTYYHLKRTMDFLLAAILITFSLPLFLIISILIKLDSKGPILFRQERTGKDGKVFRMNKFRSMVADNDLSDTTCSDKCTRIGKILRKTSIDELPQLFNILFGQMSFVGPRPWVPEYYDQMTKKERGRNKVLPGITGLAQVKGRNGITIFDKIAYDLQYVENFSLAQDFKIICATVKTILAAKDVDAKKEGIHEELRALSARNNKLENQIFFRNESRNNTKKVLIVATVDLHIEMFHLPTIKMFKDHGYEVHVATESGKKIKLADKKIKLPIKRSPLKLFSNIKAIKALKKLLAKENYDIVHCHTPVGGVVARLAAKTARRNGTRVIYTAHGFHFFTGAPIHYWMLFYPIEKYLAKYTDTLITINREDFSRARRKFSKRCRDIQYVSGVGVDPEKFKKKLTTSEKKTLRKSLRLAPADIVLTCIGRLDKNKNQGFLIRAMKELVSRDSRYHLLLVGPDEMNGKYQKLAQKLGIEKNVHFLGFRKDIPELLQISNVIVSASKREGLPVNLIESAFAGIPIVAADCRGNRDVCIVTEGHIISQGDSRNFVNNVLFATTKMSNVFDFALDSVSGSMSKIYGV